jgi:type II secretion system protein H
MKSLGFSLIEVLMVLVILSVVLTFAVIPALSHTEDRGLKVAAQKLKTTLEQARYHAIIDAKTHRLEVGEEGYYVTFLDKGKWLPSPRKGLELMPLSGVTVQVDTSTSDLKWHVSPLGLMHRSKIILGLGQSKITLATKEIGTITIQEYHR